MDLLQAVVKANAGFFEASHPVHIIDFSPIGLEIGSAAVFSGEESSLTVNESEHVSVLSVIIVCQSIPTSPSICAKV